MNTDQPTFRSALTLLMLLFQCIIPLTSSGQHTFYEPLKNRGALPSEIMYSNFKEVGAAEGEEYQKNKKIFNRFMLQNNYSIYSLLASGYILYSTPVNDYINDVADKLLAHDQALRNKLKFYIVQSAEVNAFTYNNGMIFINTGLLAHLENEAQLAFVLSHEIAHFLKGHSFKTYKHNKAIDEENDSRYSSEEESLIALTHFSREQETEADHEGMKIYLQSTYAPAEAIGLLNVLAYSDHPFDSFPLNKSFFDSRYLMIPEKYFIDSVLSAWEINTNINDTMKTHPAIPKRKQAIQAIIDQNKALPKQLYLVSENRFIEIRRICRYELSRLYLIERDYAASIYNTYLLLHQYPDDEYLYSCLLKAIYNIQIHVNNFSKKVVVKNPNKIKGELTKIHFMLSNMRNDELNAWCLRQAWDISKKWPLNTEMKMFVKAITRDFEEYVSNKTSYFKPLPAYNDSLIASFYTTTDKEITQARMKNNRGKKTKKIRLADRGSYAPYAMPDYLEDAEFTSVFNEISKTVVTKNDKHEENEEMEEDAPAQHQKSRKKDQDKRKKNDRSYEIDRILLVDLSNIKIDERREEKIRYDAMKSKKDDFINMIKFCASKTNLDVQLMLPEIFTIADSTTFSDRNFFSVYIDERKKNAAFSEYLGTDYQTINDLSSKYGTKYIGIIYNAGIILPKDYGDMLLSSVFMLLVFPPYIVYNIYEMASPNRESYLVFELYDVSTGKLVHSQKNVYNKDSYNDLMKAELYNTFLKVKNK